MAALLIIPGSFATAQMYYPLLAAIATRSPTMATYVNNLPSAIRNPPEQAATLQDDAVFFRGIIEKLGDEGKDIVLMGHSYGGVVATETVQGVTKKEREAKGLKGGVVRIVYLAAHAPAEGQSLNNEAGDPPAALAKIGEDHFISILAIEPAAMGTFPDLPLPEAVGLVKAMGRHSNLSFTSKVTHSGWKDVPVSWILPENDFIIAPNMQRKYIDAIERESGRKVDLHVVEGAGHCPSLTCPEKVAEILVKIVDGEKCDGG